MYPQRLTNLSQTDIAPLLPLPVVAEPASSTPVNSDSQIQQNYQPAVLEHVLALLQDCDTSYMYVWLWPLQTLLLSSCNLTDAAEYQNTL